MFPLRVHTRRQSCLICRRTLSLSTSRTETSSVLPSFSGWRLSVAWLGFWGRGTRCTVTMRLTCCHSRQVCVAANRGLMRSYSDKGIQCHPASLLLMWIQSSTIPPKMRESPHGRLSCPVLLPRCEIRQQGLTGISQLTMASSL